MNRLYFSGGAFLCYGLSMVCRLLEEGGTPCQKRARPDWWYAPGTAGLNLGVAVSLDWDRFDFFLVFPSLLDLLTWFCAVELASSPSGGAIFQPLSLVLLSVWSMMDCLVI